MVKLDQGSTYVSVTDLFPRYVSPLVSQQMKLGPFRVIHLCRLPRTFLVLALKAPCLRKPLSPGQIIRLATLNGPGCVLIHPLSPWCMCYYK